MIKSLEPILRFVGDVLKNPTEKPLLKFEIVMAVIVVVAILLASSKDILRMVLQAIFKIEPNFEFVHVLGIGLLGLVISFSGLFILELIWAQRD